MRGVLIREVPIGAVRAQPDAARRATRQAMPSSILALAAVVVVLAAAGFAALRRRDLALPV
ncbi:hypothetical protein [Cellulomonas hominis]